jgi:hypothetical protein
MTAIQAFSGIGVSLPTPMTYTTTYDAMGRPASLTDSFSQTWANSVQYDVAGRMTSLQYPGSAGSVTEAMSYNANGQLMSKSWSGGGLSGGLSYSYSATQNNGQITQMVDTISGETITYAYDALKRLVLASSTPNAGSTPTAWTQTYQYDGFGNLGPTGADPATNRLIGPGYDNNGNMLGGGSYQYDGRNRFVNTSWPYGDAYFYDPQNRRVYQSGAGPSGNWEQITLYGGVRGTAGDL